jgi:hypothetical protein
MWPNFSQSYTTPNIPSPPPPFPVALHELACSGVGTRTHEPLRLAVPPGANALLTCNYAVRSVRESTPVIRSQRPCGRPPGYALSAARTMVAARAHLLGEPRASLAIPVPLPLRPGPGPRSRAAPARRIARRGSRPCTVSRPARLDHGPGHGAARTEVGDLGHRERPRRHGS